MTRLSSSSLPLSACMTALLLSFAVLAGGSIAQTDSQPQSSLTIHVVQRNETLFEISLDYATSENDIVRINKLSNGSDVYVGQRLLVPRVDGTVEVEYDTYVIQPGDNLSSIANQYDTNVNALLSLNNIDNPNSIYAGQEIRVTARSRVVSPDSLPDNDNNQPQSSLPPVSDVADGVSSSLPLYSTNIYTVQSGDTMFQIAQLFDLSVNDVATANSIDDVTRIYEGQQLVIPGLTPAQTPSDLPQPLVSVQVDPLILIEGETVSFRVMTSSTVQVLGTFLGRSLYFGSSADQTYISVAGVPLFTEAGIYPVQVNVQGSGFNTVYNFSVRVIPGAYGFQDLTIDAQLDELLAPAVEDYERDLLIGITEQDTEMLYLDGLMALPSSSPNNGAFGIRRSYNGGEVNRYHSGADFANPPGTPVYAVAAGRVVLSDKLNIRGNALVIDHGWGVFTTYSHMTEALVSLGQDVQSGQVVGYAGSTGRVTGAHLHWEVWINGVPVNPMTWVRKRFL